MRNQRRPKQQKEKLKKKPKSKWPPLGRKDK
jgi:hypothetical protein